MSDEFVSAAPPSGGIDFKDHKGSLLVVDVLGVEAHVPTVHTKPGEQSPAVRANVYVITGPGESDDYEDTLIFPKVLQGQLKGKIGSKVVGRLTQGVAKPGQSAPWLIDAATEDDLAKARQWVAARTGAQFASAAPATQSAQAPF